MLPCGDSLAYTAERKVPSCFLEIDVNRFFQHVSLVHQGLRSVILCRILL